MSEPYIHVPYSIMVLHLEFFMYFSVASISLCRRVPKWSFSLFGTLYSSERKKRALPFYVTFAIKSTAPGSWSCPETSKSHTCILDMNWFWDQVAITHTLFRYVDIFLELHDVLCDRDNHFSVHVCHDLLNVPFSLQVLCSLSNAHWSSHSDYLQTE